METDDDPNVYLNYLNDEETTQNFLLTSEEGITDNFAVEPIFTEIDPSDWPTVLLSSNLISEETDELSDVNAHISNKVITTLNENPEDSIDRFVVEKSTTDKNPVLNSQKTYINYSPIVKEKEDGNKEIYLTEKDINNDAKIIQLLNTDGSVITIDKSILNSISLPVQQKTKSVSDFFTTVTANKCKLCGFLCERVDRMKEHLNTKHPEELIVTSVKPPFDSHKTGLISVLNKNRLNSQTPKECTIFVCSICKDICFDKETLKQHMVEKHNCRSNPNKVDNVELESKQKTLSSLKALSSFLIKKQQKALKKVRCSVPGCKLLFPTESIKEKHEKYHVGENKKHFKCLECGDIFSYWRICKSHLWKTHKIDMGLFVCPMCNNFKSIKSGCVINHMAIHSEEKPFLCPVCDKGFKTLSQMKTHSAYHQESNKTPNWSTLKKCETCSRFFANSKTLKKHVQSVHENFKPFICNICGHKTSRKAMLEMHLRQHTGIKPHKCPYCDYRTGDHNCLRKHIMKHVGAHQYQCQHCTYTCIQSASLKGHMFHKHPGKSGMYTCKYCTYTSINEDACLAHEKCHEISAKQNNDLGVNAPEDDVEDYTTPINYIHVKAENDNDETCFLNTDHSNDETVDTGGITIPAGFELQLVN